MSLTAWFSKCLDQVRSWALPLISLTKLRLILFVILLAIYLCWSSDNRVAKRFVKWFLEVTFKLHFASMVLLIDFAGGAMIVIPQVVAGDGELVLVVFDGNRFLFILSVEVEVLIR